MIYDFKAFTIIAFILINFLAIFLARKSLTSVIAVLSSHLVLVLFLSILVSSYLSFKESVLAVIIYSMATIFLISDQIEENEMVGSGEIESKFLIVAAISVSVMTAFLLLIYVVGSVHSVIEFSANPQRLNPELGTVLPTEAAKAGTQGKIAMEIENKKPDKLLFKHYSDLILIIVGISIVGLLYKNYSAEER